MALNPPTQPILQRKQGESHETDREGILKFCLHYNGSPIISNFYTRVDQVFLVWGLITAVIFCTAQFLNLRWSDQAVLWSALTLVGAWCTVHLSWCWVSLESLRWVVYLWVGLIIGGIGLTNLSILGGVWELMPYLCWVWLIVSALGYLTTAWGLRSRAFLWNGFLHLASVAGLPFVNNWQFLFTGLVTAGSLFLFAEVQWDMNYVPAPKQR